MVYIIFICIEYYRYLLKKMIEEYKYLFFILQDQNVEHYMFISGLVIACKR